MTEFPADVGLPQTKEELKAKLEKLRKEPQPETLFDKIARAIESGCEFVCTTPENIMLFRKRK